MSIESAQDFLAKAKEGDEAVRKVYESVPENATEEAASAAILAAAKAAGWDFAIDELKEAAVMGQEVSDEELDSVAGGMKWDQCTINHYKEKCSANVNAVDWCWKDDDCWTIYNDYTIIGPKYSDRC